MSRSCGLDVPLQAGGSVLFGFENGVENFEKLRGLIGLTEEDEDPRDSVERVWLPVYKFEVPQALAGIPWSQRSGSMMLDEKDHNVDSSVGAAHRREMADMSDEEDLHLLSTVKLLGRVGPTKSAPPAITPAMTPATTPALRTPATLTPQSRTGTKTPETTPKRSPTAWKKTARIPKVPELRAPEMCGIVRAEGTTQWFPSVDEVLDEGDLMILSQGSASLRKNSTGP
ncbi:hypothetical protein AK812_SmicGene5293 [Symbiodinium microadriaticum]|uniref:Uncharacterized protein n=1 Tax=Symbiodinium microadriaticum TaxID=2951 RepID=A0A1Q9EU60_SYMMI|nr:hypothetical protein AK812_SmicGene5293 [Symbiodinium microadriaticum]